MAEDDSVMNEEESILSHLRYRVTVEHVEGDGSLRDMGLPPDDIEKLSRLGKSPMWKQKWDQLNSAMQPNDELWHYGWDEGFLSRGGGYAVLREGKVVASITSWKS